MRLQVTKLAKCFATANFCIKIKAITSGQLGFCCGSSFPLCCPGGERMPCKGTVCNICSMKRVFDSSKCFKRNHAFWIYKRSLWNNTLWEQRCTFGSSEWQRLFHLLTFCWGVGVECVWGEQTSNNQKTRYAIRDVFEACWSGRADGSGDWRGCMYCL